MAEQNYPAPSVAGIQRSIESQVYSDWARTQGLKPNTIRDYTACILQIADRMQAKEETGDVVAKEMATKHRTAWFGPRGFMAFWNDPPRNNAALHTLPRPTKGQPLTVDPLHASPEDTKRSETSEIAKALAKVEGIDNVCATADGTNITFTMSLPRKSTLAKAIIADRTMGLVPRRVAPTEQYGAESPETNRGARMALQEIASQILGGVVTPTQVLDLLPSKTPNTPELKQFILERTKELASYISAINLVYKVAVGTDVEPQMNANTKARMILKALPETNIVDTVLGENQDKVKPLGWREAMLNLLHSELEPDCPLPKDVNDKNPALVQQTLERAIKKLSNREQAMKRFTNRLLGRIGVAFPGLTDADWDALEWGTGLDADEADTLMDAVHEIRAKLGEEIIETTLREVAKHVFSVELPPGLNRDMLIQQLQHLRGSPKPPKAAPQTEVPYRTVVFEISKTMLGRYPNPTATPDGILNSLRDKWSATQRAASTWRTSLGSVATRLGSRVPDDEPVKMLEEIKRLIEELEKGRADASDKKWEEALRSVEGRLGGEDYTDAETPEDVVQEIVLLVRGLERRERGCALMRLAQELSAKLYEQIVEEAHKHRAEEVEPWMRERIYLFLQAARPNLDIKVVNEAILARYDEKERGIQESAVDTLLRAAKKHAMSLTG